MIITRKHALRLIRDGRAEVTGATYFPNTATRDFVIIIRYDKTAEDHYPYTEADRKAVDTAERDFGGKGA